MFVVSAAASSARAEPNDLGRGFDIGRWIDQGVRFLVQSTQGSKRPVDPSAASSKPSLSELEAMFPTTDPTLRDEVIRTGTLGFAHAGSLGTPLGIDKGRWYTHESGKHALQPALRFSLVARDWKGAYSIFGHAVATDEIRLTRSSRMLIGRISAGDGPLVPFFHVGVGEWRYDPDHLLPPSLSDQEYATQFSGGLELRLSKHASFAWENDYVILCRERREVQNMPTPYILGSFAVLQLVY